MVETCEFSEFTYGYAFTEERMRANRIRIAPLFPTLRQERSTGYDVDIAGFGFVQFKRPDILFGPRTKERQHALTPDIFRMHFTNHQHRQLLRLARRQRRLRGARVFYACPAFDTISLLNRHYRQNAILKTSVLAEATAIGTLTPIRHHLSFDASSLKKGWALLFSADPREVPLVSEEHFTKWVLGISRKPPMTAEELSAAAQTLGRLAGPAGDIPGIDTVGDRLSEAAQAEAALVSIARLGRHVFDVETILIESTHSEARQP